MTMNRPGRRTARYLAGLAFVLVSVGALADGQGALPMAPPVATLGAPSNSAKVSPEPVSRFQPDRFAGKAGRYYAAAWGIDSLSVKLMESGELIRFTYRVLDPSLAKALNDKRLTPSLVDEMRGISLVVPEMENIGMLRQTALPKANRIYWVAFSNKGRLVKRGDWVNVVIGPFHANNLVVD